MKQMKMFGILALMLVGAAMAAASESTVVYPRHDNYWSGRVRADNAGYHKHNNEMFFSYHPPDTAWHSFAKFDLSSLPDDAVIEEAHFEYYTVMVSNPPPPNDIRLVSVDPVTIGADELWADIVAGDVVSSESLHGTGWVARELDAAGVAALQAALVQDWFALGIHKTDDSETRAVAHGYANYQFRPRLTVVYSPPMPDYTVTEIVVPEVLVEAGTEVVPELVVRNDGNVDVPARVWFTINDPSGEVYREYIDLPGLGVDSELALPFPKTVLSVPLGEWASSGWVDATGDINPGNDRKVSWFLLWQGTDGQPALSWGWEEVNSVPVGPSAKGVRRGGWLAYNATRGLVYAAKGHKTAEFYSVDPLSRNWSTLSPMPYAVHPRWTKPPGRGARGVSDGRDALYVVQGNNTLGFWRYDIAADAWHVLPDVPEGVSRRKVKGGTDMVYADVDGQGYVYLLKGYRTEMYRFSIAAGSWEFLPDAPAGAKGKWAKGSWLVYDGGGTIYAHMARHHGMWSFDVRSNEWNDVGLNPMPYKGSLNRKKRLKDGGSADWHEGSIYSLKGGNTPEFWQYTPATGGWVEMPPMPEFGTNGRRIRVRHGGDLVAFAPGRTFFALKGNRSSEFWRYRMPPEGHGVQAAGAVADLPGRPGGARLAIGPNPNRTGLVGLRYTVPALVPATVTVYDLSGRVASRRRLPAAREGAANLDLGNLSAGVYLVRLEAGGLESSRRLTLVK